MANLKYCDKHNMVIFLKKPTESVGFTEVVDFLKGTTLKYALTYNPTIYDSLVKQFWQTATVRTLANGTQQLIASIDNKEYTITEASVRRTLGGYAGDNVPLLPAMLAGATEDQGEGSPNPAEPHPTPGPTFTHAAYEATTTGVGVGTEGATTTTTSLDAGLDSGNIHESPLGSHEAPLHEGHTSGSAEDSVQLKELMDLVPKVKILVKALKRKTKKVIISESEDEEPEDQGRKNQDIDDDPLVSLIRESMKDKDIEFVTPTKVSASGETQDSKISPTILEAAKTLSQVASQTISTYKRRTSTGSGPVSTGSGPVSTPSVVQTVNVVIPSPIKSQREGKAPMTTEDVTPTRRTKSQIQQEKAGLAEAIRLQALHDEEGRGCKTAEVQEVAQHYSEEDWDNIRARTPSEQSLKQMQN
ncbi:hypothetical protein Tco_0408643 [Tanacetum coccineum]